MTTKWIHRAHLIVSADLREKADDAIVAILNETEGRGTFCIPLVPADAKDDADPTHYGSDGAWTPDQVGKFRAAMQKAGAGNRGQDWHICRLHALTGTLEDASVASANAKIGGADGENWQFDKTLAELGLKRRQEPEPTEAAAIATAETVTAKPGIVGRAMSAAKNFLRIK